MHLDHVEPGDSFEVTYVGGRDSQAEADRSGGNEPVVWPDIGTCFRKVGSESSMRAGGEQVEVESRYDCENRLDEGFAPWAVFSARAVHAVE